MPEVIDLQEIDAASLRPLHRNVLIRTDEVPETIGASKTIILPQSSQRIPERGKVIALGPDARDDVSVGEYVIYDRYEGEQLACGDRVHVLIDAQHILAALERPE